MLVYDASNVTLVISSLHQTCILLTCQNREANHSFLSEGQKYNFFLPLMLYCWATNSQLFEAFRTGENKRFNTTTHAWSVAVDSHVCRKGDLLLEWATQGTLAQGPDIVQPRDWYFTLAFGTDIWC